MSQKNNVLLGRNVFVTPTLSHSDILVDIHNGRSLVSLSLKGVGIGLKFGTFVPTKLLGHKIHIEKRKKSKK